MYTWTDPNNKALISLREKAQDNAQYILCWNCFFPAFKPLYLVFFPAAMLK
jgi:hypothetical protein